MTFELDCLALAVLLGLVQLLVAAQTGTQQRGFRWAAGPRDEPKPPLTGMAGRLDRAFRNFGETFALFAAAILVAHIAGKSGALTRWGAGLYLVGRIAYVPLYASGIFLVRSLAWNVATLGIILILIALCL